MIKSDGKAANLYKMLIGFCFSCMLLHVKELNLVQYCLALQVYESRAENKQLQDHRFSERAPRDHPIVI